MVSNLSLTKDTSFSHRGHFFLSQIYTDEQNTQRPIKIEAPPPSPPPKGRGVITEIPLLSGCRLRVVPYWQSCRGNLTYYAPPYGGGEGGGASWGECAST